MRFLEDGPNIPDALIEARELGEVVFFCGAGVSLPALPDFDGLTRRLLDGLGAQESRDAYSRGESLDRVFSSLVKEFGGSEVDRAVGAALRTPRGADLRHHRTVLDLSRDRDGFARIVTTNFDRLFERVDPTLTRYVPPVLPDLGVLEPLRGLVYLHGRLGATPSRARAGYILSSADFGRAYLAEGWAARFVRGLRERYTIVLIGYSANDPPMRYLLEGLNSREGAAYRTSIYAWRDAGQLRAARQRAFGPMGQLGCLGGSRARSRWLARSCPCALQAVTPLLECVRAWSGCASSRDNGRCAAVRSGQTAAERRLVVGA